MLTDFTGAFNSVPPYATVQADAFTFGGIAGGSANALTLSLTPALGAYSNGLNIRFTSGAAANTGATTISVNGLAATAVQLAGAALTGGEIQPTRVYAVVYYNTVFHLFQPTAQAPLNITTTAAGAIATWTSTDGGATSGPDLVLDRFSPSLAANDAIGSIQFNGRDSGGGTETYAAIMAEIQDPTATSEDGRLRIRTRQGGGNQDWLIDRGAIYHSSLLNKGAGDINAVGLYVSGHGTVAQVVSDTEAAYTTLGTIIPLDDTIPQNTEGDEILSVAITPTNATSILRIRAVLNIGSDQIGGTVTAALFVDATAGALAASASFVQNAASMGSLVLQHEVSAASTSARTYRIRAGSSVATDAYLNGDGTSRIFGGVAISSLTVTEVLPQ